MNLALPLGLVLYCGIFGVLGLMLAEPLKRRLGPVAAATPPKAIARDG